MISEKFAESLIKDLQRIRYALDDIENCEDGEEMIHKAQELSADLHQIEEKIEEKIEEECFL